MVKNVGSNPFAGQDIAKNILTKLKPNIQGPVQKNEAHEDVKICADSNKTT